MSEILCPLYEISRIAPDHPGWQEGDHVYSFPVLNLAARQAARRFRGEFGLQPGDRVVIAAPTEWRWIPALFALFRVGAIACPLNTRMPHAGLRARAAGLKPALQILGDTGDPILPEVPCVRLSGLCEATMLGERDPAPVTLNLTAPASILYTTGSMGHPLAVVHTLENHYYSALGANRHLPLTTSHRCLVSLPLYHVGGLAQLFRALLGGACLVSPEPGLDPVESVITARVTHLSLVPTQLIRFLAHPRAREAIHLLQGVLLGGAPIPRELVAKALNAGMPVHSTYGLTETASQVCTVGRYAGRAQRESTDGEVLPHRQIKVDENGHILVRGHVLARGQWKDGAIQPLPLEDGWCRTGDLGRLDNGFLTVTGRADLVFISGGENIQPEEIERALLEITGADAVVVTACSDPEFGARPLAWVHLPEGAFTPEAWSQQLRTRLPGYMIPAAYRPMPPAAGLKPDRRALQALSTKV